MGVIVASDCRLKHFLGRVVAERPSLVSWSASAVSSGRTDTVGFPSGSQTRTLGGDTVTWIPRTPRGIGSGFADQTASSTRYGMLRTDWSRRPLTTLDAPGLLIQSRGYGKPGPSTLHMDQIGRRLADRTKLPASGGLGQSLPDLPRSGLSAPRAMKVTGEEPSEGNYAIQKRPARSSQQ